MLILLVFLVKVETLIGVAPGSFLIIFSESRFFPNILFRIKNLSETSFQNQESSSALKQETVSAANLLIITTNFIILCSMGAQASSESA